MEQLPLRTYLAYTCTRAQKVQQQQQLSRSVAAWPAKERKKGLHAVKQGLAGEGNEDEGRLCVNNRRKGITGWGGERCYISLSLRPAIEHD